MTVKNRIATIRLAERINRNQEYAASIGVSIVNGKAEPVKSKKHKNKATTTVDE